MARTTQRPYIKVDQSLGDHPKSLALAPKHYRSALGLHVLGIGYSDRMRSDGFIPSNILPRIAGLAYKPDVAELVRVGFWVEAEGGYQIHDYLDWQDSAEDLSAKSEKARAANDKRWGTPQRTPQGTPQGTPPDPILTDPILTEPNRSDPDADEDAPKSVQRYLSLLRIYGHTVAIAPSEAVKRMIRAWGSVGYSDEAVEDALRIAIDNEARQPWEYANTVLLNRRTQPSAEDAYLERKYGGAE